MFDVGASELLVIVIVAILVIGPKDMPMALRAAGRWIGKMRRMSNHFRAGIDTMIREAEMEEMEKQWAERNKEIMAKYPEGDEEAGGAASSPAQADAAAEAAIARAAPEKAPEHGGTDLEPGLPLDPPPAPPAKEN